MPSWNCQAVALTHAARADAWAFWTNMDNHARMEDGVKAIELDGPIESGTTGRTITEAYQQEWTLQDVVPEQHFAILGYTPDGQGWLRFAWAFEDQGTGTRITYRISAQGPQLDAYAEFLQGLEARIGPGIKAVAAELDRLFEQGAFEG